MMIEPLRILMISHHRLYKTSGRPLVMARHLCRLGHQITLLTTANHARFGYQIHQENGLEIIEAPDLLWDRLRSGWDPWSTVSRIHYLRNTTRGYDLIHCFETRPATIHPALAYRKWHSIPLITDWNDWFGRGGLITIKRPAWYRVLLAWMETYYEEAYRTRASGLTVISSALEARAMRLGVPKERICLIPGGTNLEEVPYHSREECRSHTGYPMDKPLLGFASADSHLDLDVIFGALRILKETYPEIELVITGKVQNSVIDRAKKYQVEKALILPGFLAWEDLLWQLGCADVFLLPFPETIYNVGRFPNKLGLYLSLGRPIVANPVGDIQRLFLDKTIGLPAEESSESFARVISSLLSQPTLCKEMGKRARRLAETDYNWVNLIQGLNEFYYRIIALPEVKG